MDRLISCEFNMDNACVELKFFDGSMIAIDTIAVENEVADNMYQRSELDYLIYNAPLEYADLMTVQGCPTASGVYLLSWARMPRNGLSQKNCGCYNKSRSENNSKSKSPNTRIGKDKTCGSAVHYELRSRFFAF